MSQAPSAVRFFAPEHPQVARTARAKIERDLSSLMTSVATGYAADWGDYKERVGVIKGLAQAIEICKQVEHDLTGEG